jgi:hypothetical protein
VRNSFKSDTICREQAYQLTQSRENHDEEIVFNNSVRFAAAGAIRAAGVSRTA